MECECAARANRGTSRAFTSIPAADRNRSGVTEQELSVAARHFKHQGHSVAGAIGRCNRYLADACIVSCRAQRIDWNLLLADFQPQPRGGSRTAIDSRGPDGEGCTWKNRAPRLQEVRDKGQVAGIGRCRRRFAPFGTVDGEETGSRFGYRAPYCV